MPTRAVFLVHGVGAQKKGEFLQGVLDPLLTFLENNFEVTEKRVVLRPEEGPAFAEVSFRSGEVLERWEIWEAYWADAFHDLKPQEVLVWGWRTGILNLGNIFVGSVPGLRRLLQRVFRRKGPLGITEDDPFYPRVRRGVWARAYDLVVGLALAAILLATYFPILLTASALYVLALLPKWLLFPDWLRTLVVRLVAAVMEGPGDQYMLMFTQAARESVNRRLIELMEPYLDQSRPDESRKHCDSVAVIAHSGGTTVSFATLSDPDLRSRWGTPQTRISLLTTGSSLNIARESAPDHPMWGNRLPHMGWVDLWARYDYISHGPAGRDLVEAVRGTSPGGLRGYYRSVRVVNRDSPFSDHHTYWGNHEEVVSRFLYEIPREQHDAPPPEEIGRVVRGMLDRIAEHRRRIRLKTFAALVVALVAIAAGTWLKVIDDRGLIELIGDWVLGAVAALLGDESAESGLLRWLRQSAPQVVRIVVGAGLLGSAFFTGWQLLSLSLGPRAPRVRRGLGLFAFVLLALAVATILWLGLTTEVLERLGQSIQDAATRLGPVPDYPVGLVVFLVGLYALWTLFSLWVLDPLLYRPPWEREV